MTILFREQWPEVDQLGVDKTFEIFKPKDIYPGTDDSTPPLDLLSYTLSNFVNLDLMLTNWRKNHQKVPKFRPNLTRKQHPRCEIQLPVTLCECFAFRTRSLQAYLSPRRKQERPKTKAPNSRKTYPSKKMEFIEYSRILENIYRFSRWSKEDGAQDEGADSLDYKCGRGEDGV